ncbi:MAG: hypothetical protein KGM44_05830 [bacterium]|nr:hypothetical protein [bacterium]
MLALAVSLTFLGAVPARAAEAPSMVGECSISVSALTVSTAPSTGDPDRDFQTAMRQGYVSLALARYEASCGKDEQLKAAARRLVVPLERRESAQFRLEVSGP